jgi:hypothetical protein
VLVRETSSLTYVGITTGVSCPLFKSSKAEGSSSNSLSVGRPSLPHSMVWESPLDIKSLFGWARYAAEVVLKNNVARRAKGIVECFMVTAFVLEYGVWNMEYILERKKVVDLENHVIETT